MSRDSILKIKETEQRAERIVEEAKLRARTMVEEAEAAGEKLCADTEERTRAEIASMKETLRERTAETVKLAGEEAQDEAEEIRKTAFLNKRGAEKIVIRGLMSKCR